ncbi:MAG: hypothetical protein V9E98_09675 [Candidatus Nanopelagicales bacterium]
MPKQTGEGPEQSQQAREQPQQRPQREADPAVAEAVSAAAVDAAVGQALTAIAAADDLEALKSARLAHAGDRSPLALANRGIAALPAAAKADAGKRVGQARRQVQAALDERQHGSRGAAG